MTSFDGFNAALPVAARSFAKLRGNRHSYIYIYANKSDFILKQAHNRWQRLFTKSYCLAKSSLFASVQELLQQLPKVYAVYNNNKNVLLPEAYHKDKPVNLASSYEADAAALYEEGSALKKLTPDSELLLQNIFPGSNSVLLPAAHRT